MTPFTGFSASETFTQVPDTLFRLLGEIDDLNELKVTFYVLWRIEHMEGAFRQICRSEILEDDGLMRGLTADGLDSGLAKAVQRGTLLQVENAEGGFYFLNSPRGRASAAALKTGQWRAAGLSQPPREVPNIYKLYEENLGPLSPLLADLLREAEQAYPPEWIAEAFEVAVTRNVRNWKYIAAILKRWKETGHEGKHPQDAGSGAGRYANSAFSDYLDRE